MKRFSAHYLITDTGALLKNAVAEVDQNGAVSFIDTRGDLDEQERMIFYNGVLISDFKFIKDQSAETNLPKNTIQLPFPVSLPEADCLSLTDVFAMASQLQVQYPSHTIPELLEMTAQILVADAGYKRLTIPGIYLVTGADLAGLHFTSACRIKKII